MRIAIVGYGKMGRIIEEVALQRGHKIVAKIDSKNKEILKNIDFSCDVAIEFTHPDTALQNFTRLLAQNVPVVTGTTGWFGQFKALEELVQKNQVGFFYATNFSQGVYLFRKIADHAHALMGEFTDYELKLSETHHTEKKDAPSGTAITLANDFLAIHKKIESWSKEDEEGTLFVESHREKDVPGTHRLTYHSDEDEIALIHQAKNRNGFALGAVLAAEWILGKKGIYTMKDMMGF